MSLVQTKVEQLGAGYLTLYQVAHDHRTTPNAVYLWLRKRGIHAVKVGQTIMVTPEQVADFQPKVRGRINKR